MMLDSDVLLAQLEGLRGKLNPTLATGVELAIELVQGVVADAMMSPEVEAAVEKALGKPRTK